MWQQTYRYVTAREREKFEDVVLLALKMEKGTISQGMRWPQEAGESKETDCPLEPPEGNTALLTPGF